MQSTMLGSSTDKKSPAEFSLSRDLVRASVELTDEEAGYLVTQYYLMQEDRKRASNQEGALGASGKPHAVLAWLVTQNTTLEGQLKRALDAYTSGHVMGEWLRGVYGIGPVIAAGLLAHIKMDPWRCMRPEPEPGQPYVMRCKEGSPCTPGCSRQRITSAGQIWRYAGMDPTSVWEKGKIRPYNADLKVLCWKAGQSFMKMSGSDECFYGHKYKERKAYEVERNDSGRNKDLAATLLPKYSPSTEAYKHLQGGKLPPAQIDARARRWAVKLFLAHFFEVYYKIKWAEEPPAPYPIAHLGHAHYIAPPAPVEKKKKPVKKKA